MGIEAEAGEIPRAEGAVARLEELEESWNSALEHGNKDPGDSSAADEAGNSSDEDGGEDVDFPDVTPEDFSITALVEEFEIEEAQREGTHDGDTESKQAMLLDTVLRQLADAAGEFSPEAA